ncbi:MAG: glycogen/starch/alpha-glucan phosphorylase [Planctomycetaceae bacterium]|nr:glycogen/starch/alpha-glucan phosphorylase [Planctomycetaceae bacterium]
MAPTATTVAPKNIFDADTEKLEQAFEYHLQYSLAKDLSTATSDELFAAVALSVRNFCIEQLNATEQRYQQQDAKRCFYLSMEFLMGQSLENNLRNLGLLTACRDVLSRHGLKLEEILHHEPDAGLGNGGLGRLAACFLDSLASLDMPGYGYGINYQYGLFRQVIVEGYQREQPDNWQIAGSPWLIERPAEACVIPLYGRVEHGQDRDGNFCPRWVDWQAVVGIPADLPIVGFGGDTVNSLRLFTAAGSREFDMGQFNQGDYMSAVRQKFEAENISKVLYPSDNFAQGKELRLIQEYFLVACSIRDIVRQLDASGRPVTDLPSQVAIQLNDTHPALSVAELMRLLVDERDMVWEDAWKLTEKTLAYTNHTLLPEALECWSLDLIQRVLPRHLEIIYEVNRRFMDQVREQWPSDYARQGRMSIVDDSARSVRMCNLAVVGSHSVNGVSAMHSELVKNELLADFHSLWPEKFNNKTNGITPRRWLYQANPGLSELITETIGEGWIRDLDQLQMVDPFADDAAFREQFAKVKRRNKVELGKLIRQTSGVVVDPDSLFDVQVKRIHEYKRQLLNILRVIHDYFSIVDYSSPVACPRTYIFSGKAAPGYWAAKQLIKLVNSLAAVINRDPRANRLMKVVFIPNYRVSVAERIFPASELSEQISTAGYEASGTGNMKFALNGALTIGTLDGANIEIREEVGDDNIFIFGLNADEVAQKRREGYEPGSYYHNVPQIRRVLDALRTSRFCPQEPGLFGWIADSLIQHDEYLLLADFESYVAAQEQVSQAYTNQETWNRMAIHNTARVGKFSSDRTIREYASDIWQIRSAVSR